MAPPTARTVINAASENRRKRFFVLKISNSDQVQVLWTTGWTTGDCSDAYLLSACAIFTLRDWAGEEYIFLNNSSSRGESIPFTKSSRSSSSVIRTSSL